MRIGGNILFAIRGAYVLADILLAQGRLREAIRTYERSLSLAAEQGKRVLRGTADLHLRLSELYREQNNLNAAQEHLLKSEELGEQAASPHWAYRLCRAQARVMTVPGKIGRRARTAGSGRTPLRQNPRPRRATGRSVEGAAMDRPGQVGRSPGLGE